MQRLDSVEREANLVSNVESFLQILLGLLIVPTCQNQFAKTRQCCAAELGEAEVTRHAESFLQILLGLLIVPTCQGNLSQVDEREIYIFGDAESASQVESLLQPLLGLRVVSLQEGRHAQIRENQTLPVTVAMLPRQGQPFAKIVDCLLNVTK